jgi:hypothetical protein
MSNRISLLWVALGLMSTAALLSFQAHASEPITMTCDMFAMTPDLDSLKRSIGAANVAMEKVAAAEGEEAEATVIYPKDRTRRAFLFWKDEAAHRGVASLMVRAGDDADPLSWHYAGLSIESGVAEIEAVNGKPFVFSGFGWDYGGYVVDWKGGKLQSPAGGCHVTMRLTPGANAAGPIVDKVSGDKKFSSSDAKVRAAKPHIGEITLEFQ